MSARNAKGLPFIEPPVPSPVTRFPSSAITIELGDDGGFVLLVPSPVQLHHIHVPPTEAGLKAMRKILAARSNGEGQKISQPANPTQWQVNEWLKAERIVRQEEAAARAAEALAKKVTDAQALFAGIDIGELDL